MKVVRYFATFLAADASLKYSEHIRAVQYRGLTVAIYGIYVGTCIYIDKQINTGMCKPVCVTGYPLLDNAAHDIRKRRIKQIGKLMKVKACDIICCIRGNAKSITYRCTCIYRYIYITIDTYYTYTDAATDTNRLRYEQAKAKLLQIQIQQQIEMQIQIKI